MVVENLTRAVIVQALYVSRANKANRTDRTNKKAAEAAQQADVQHVQQQFNLEGIIRMKSRFTHRSNQAAALDLQVSGVVHGKEYCTILPFAAFTDGATTTFRKSAELTDFKETVYDHKLHEWYALDKQLQPQNTFFFENLYTAITAHLHQLLQNKASEANLRTVLERKYLYLGDSHASSGFPTQYLDSLLRLSRREQREDSHEIVLTRAKTLQVQYARKAVPQRRIRDGLSDGAFDYVLGNTAFHVPDVLDGYRS